MDRARSPSSVLRVFLSSTFVDLQAHRAAVRDIIGRLGQFTLAMEQFGAREDDAQTVSTDLVSGCDLYLGVIAWRYGYVPDGEQRSVTHLEYEEAGRLGIPRLVFLAAHETQAADGPDALFPASARDPEHLELLLAFRAEIERAQVVDYFTTPDDLAKKVAAALYQYLQAHPIEQGTRPPRDLPPRAPGFVGRKGDLETLCAALRQGQHMAVSAAVAGMGGVGKSSLAAEVVHLLAAEPGAFPGGITWVRCDERTGIEGLTWIEDQLLAAWNAPISAEAAARAATPEAGLELRERALRERLRSEGNTRPAPALVLLDNVERDLPLARLLDTLAPLGITTLLTSRSEPSSPRVRLLRLDVLEPEPAVALFAGRFMARGGTWSAEVDGIATRAIVEALGGLPLAIELAAARAARTGLPLSALADELRAPDALARLSDPLDPSASVRYSLGKTLGALSAIQRAHFAALGLPEGPEWPEAVVARMLEQLPAPAEERHASTAGDLEVLAAYSLLSFVAGREGSRRIRLHPLVRELAREELARQSDAMQRGALAGLLTGVSAWVNRWIAGFVGLADARSITVLTADEDLIAAALRQSYTRHVDLPLVLSTTTTFQKYLEFLNKHWTTEEFGVIQLQAARALGDRAGELEGLRSLSRSAEWTGRHSEAARYREEALPLARALGDQTTVVEFTAAIGATAAGEGRLNDAQRRYEEALTAMHESGDQQPEGRVLNILGILATKLMRLDEAAALLDQAYVSAHATGDTRTEAVARHNLGEVFDIRGDYAEAEQLYMQALRILLALQEANPGADTGEGFALDKLGEIALKTGDLESAISYFDSAQQVFGHSQLDPAMLPHLHGNQAVTRGETARLQGDLDEARRAYEEALSFYAQEISTPVNHMTRNYIVFAQERIAQIAQDQVAREPALADARDAKRRRRWPWSRG